MHELSIAQAIVAIADRHAGGARIETVSVRVGRLRQVVPEALEFSFALCAEGTVAEAATLELQEVAIGVRCTDCGADSAPQCLPLACQQCGSTSVEVVRGEELQVESLELEAEPMTSGR